MHEIPNVIGDTGLVFEQKNVPALTRCLKLLIENEVLREELAERGYKRVLEKYSHEAIARDTYFFWKEIFAG